MSWIFTLELILFVVLFFTGLMVALFQKNLFWSLPRWVRIGGMLSLLLLVTHIVYTAHEYDEAREITWVENAREWPTVPLRVTWDRRGFEAFNDGIEEAMAVWNRAAGCELLREASAVGTADVRIASADGAPCGKINFDADDPIAGADVAGGAWWCPNMKADVQIKRLGMIDEAHKVFVHELGHVLGLAHDEGGVMGPYADRIEWIIPSRKDAKALAERYCK